MTTTLCAIQMSSPGSSLSSKIALWEWWYRRCMQINLSSSLLIFDFRRNKRTIRSNSGAKNKIKWKINIRKKKWNHKKAGLGWAPRFSTQLLPSRPQFVYFRFTWNRPPFHDQFHHTKNRLFLNLKYQYYRVPSWYCLFHALYNRKLHLTLFFICNDNFRRVFMN